MIDDFVFFVPLYFTKGLAKNIILKKIISIGEYNETKIDKNRLHETILS